MGVVYKALDERLGRHVALKFLPPHLGLRPEAKRRFLLEARAAATLDHPNICTIHEIGETSEGQLFIAMPLYNGETLQARLMRGPLPCEDAVAVARQIASGLQQAHEHGCGSALRGDGARLSPERSHEWTQNGSIVGPTVDGWD